MDSFMPQPLYLLKKRTPQYLLNRRLGRYQSWYGYFKGEKRKPLAHVRNQTSDHQAHRPVISFTTQFQLILQFGNCKQSDNYVMRLRL